MSSIEAEVVAFVPDPDRFAELAVSWLSQARQALVPEFTLALEDKPARARASLLIQRRPTLLGTREVRYTRRSWAQALATVGHEPLYHLELVMELVDERGELVTPFRGATLGVHRHHREPGWITLAAEAQVGSLGDADPEATAPYPGQDQWASLVKQWVVRADACYAHVTDDASVTQGTALEQATFYVRDESGLRTPESTIPRCHQVLRGYSWVTVCAAELAARLGGGGCLAASGAFAEVSELPGGQVFLRATPAIEDYHGEAVREVFQTLAPVLLTGQPDPMAPIMSRARLVPDADAADYRGES